MSDDYSYGDDANRNIVTCIATICTPYERTERCKLIELKVEKTQVPEILRPPPNFLKQWYDYPYGFNSKKNSEGFLATWDVVTGALG